ncbi:NUDIX domain-containing protein [Agaribacterium haliotis]|uniref:NUDIX domain-containing protein n=1 Tax=Agaribacterium haliotis TaxID=2013869 RepID=UPI000BB54AA4|nr:NUDIX hydrolase [Agaribacterium haliotis]
MIDRKVVEKVGGWKRLSKEVVYENPWIEVSHEQVLRPNGTEGIYGLVSFKGCAVAVVPISENGDTWLVKQSRYAMDEITIEVPEGGASRDEDPALAALRELEEEVGLKAEKIEKILELQISNSITNERAHVFVATGLSEGMQALEDTEDIEVIKLPLSEAISMAQDGRITDVMSVAALLKIALDGRYL